MLLHGSMQSLRLPAAVSRCHSSPSSADPHTLFALVRAAFGQRRKMLRQSLSFFTDDFAGRIAQKQMQAARAATDLIVDMIHTVAFALASLLGSVILLFTIDARSALLLALWAISYIALIRFFMPRIRMRSKARAATRAMVTGQVVGIHINEDVITNGRLDSRKTQTVSRLGYMDYAVVNDTFELMRPKV